MITMGEKKSKATSGAKKPDNNDQQRIQWEGGAGKEKQTKA